MPADPCSELSKVITKLALNIGSRPDVKNLDHVVTELQKHIPEITRDTLVASINEATTGQARAKSELQAKLSALKGEARKDANLRRAIGDLQWHLAGGTQPETPAPRVDRNPDAIKALSKRRADLRQQLRQADPAKRQEIRARIAELNKAVADGTYIPPAKSPEAPADLAALRAERDRLRGLMEMNDPAKRAAVRAQIAELDKAAKAGEYVPPAETKKASVPADLAKLRADRDALRRDVNQNDPAKRKAVQKQIAKLDEAIKTGTYPNSEAKATRKSPADLAELRSRRDALKSQLEAFNPERVKEWQSKLDELDAHLKAGTLPEESKPAAVERNPEVAALKQKRDAVLAALRQSDPAIRKKFEAQITNLTDRLEHATFTKPEPKAERPLSKELARLEYQRDTLKRQVRRRIQALQPKTLWGHVSEPFNAARALMTSMDFSAVFRQGGVLAISHPIRAARAIPDMLRAFASDEKSYQVNKEIFARDNAPLYAKSKLFLSDVGESGLTKQEEAFVSTLAGKVPFVKGSERAYVTFLNRMRADSFDAMARGLGRDGEVTKPEAEAIANYINVATGRAKLPGSFEKAADALNTVFFAPRLAASRFQIIMGQPLIGGTAATRMLIAKEYARFLGGAGVVFALGVAAGGKVETDPRSSDFGKIRFGNTRLDPLGGLGQATVLVSRVVSGKTKTANGKLERTTPDVASRFLRGKLSPVIGGGTDLAFGENVVGEKVGALDVASRLVVPLSFRDIYETMQEQGVPKGAALSTLSLFGMGVNTYKPKPVR